LNAAIFRKASAWLPLAMSTLALLIVLGHVAMTPTVPQADEGPAAHLFQLLIAGQAPIVAFFAFKWMPRWPAPAMFVIAAQAAAALVALAPVAIFDL
jgi:hypothetical protein